MFVKSWMVSCVAERKKVYPWDEIQLSAAISHPVDAAGADVRPEAHCYPDQRPYFPGQLYPSNPKI